jgi:outer membrane protein assembly factor BamE
MRKTALLIPLLVSGCSYLYAPVHWFTPYKIDIQQGNAMDEQAIAKLKPGMTKAEVRALLGSPLLQDAFHGDRWDYVFRVSKSGKLIEERTLAVFFDQDKLKRVDGDMISALDVSPAAPATAPQDVSPAPPAKPLQDVAPAPATAPQDVPPAPAKAEDK